MKEITKTYYESSDGVVFSDRMLCLQHETEYETEFKRTNGIPIIIPFQDMYIETDIRVFRIHNENDLCKLASIYRGDSPDDWYFDMKYELENKVPYPCYVLVFDTDGYTECRVIDSDLVRQFEKVTQDLKDYETCSGGRF